MGIGMHVDKKVELKMVNSRTKAAQRSAVKGRVSICIVSHDAYGAMRGGEGGHIGGVDRQTSLVAQWLAGQQYDVSVVVWDEGGPPNEVVNGVRIVKVCRRAAGMPGFRFIYPRWTSLVQALRIANADLYYHNCAECVTGQVALWCRMNGRRFIVCTASDMACNPALPTLRNPRDRMLYRYGLFAADKVIVQTRAQQAMLKTGFGLNASVLPVACPVPASAPRTRGPGDVRERVVWIARVCQQKHPDRLLALAESCPEVQFDLVGPYVSKDAYTRQLLARCERTQNVTVHGAVSRGRVSSLYLNAACLCNTSDYEGFPNTFVEAWSHGVPVVSMFDPDSVLKTKRVGFAVADVPDMARAIRSLLASPRMWKNISKSARQYFSEHHELESVLPQYEAIFLEVVQCRQGGGV